VAIYRQLQAERKKAQEEKVNWEDLSFEEIDFPVVPLKGRRVCLRIFWQEWDAKKAQIPIKPPLFAGSND
jgi:hypothetical protein